jgi:hypothetical protein
MIAPGATQRDAHTFAYVVLYSVEQLPFKSGSGVVVVRRLWSAGLRAPFKVDTP